MNELCNLCGLLQPNNDLLVPEDKESYSHLLKLRRLMVKWRERIFLEFDPMNCFYFRRTEYGAIYTLQSNYSFNDSLFWIFGRYKWHDISPFYLLIPHRPFGKKYVIVSIPIWIQNWLHRNACRRKYDCYVLVFHRKW